MQYCDGTNWVGMSNVDTGLVGHWRLDETSGTTVVDSSKNSYTGTMINGLDAANSNITGPFNTALSFDGIDDQISVFDGWLHFEKSFTVSFWIYIKDPGARTMDILGTYTGAGGNNLQFGVNGHSERIYLGMHGFGIQHQDTNELYNQWHHFVFTRNVNGNLEIFKNGVSVSNNSAGPIGSFILSNNDNLNFGEGGTGNVIFNGGLDEIRIYDRILSPAEISAFYESGRDRGLVGHYKMDETSGLTVFDSTVYGNNGTILGGSTGISYSNPSPTGTAIDFPNTPSDYRGRRVEIPNIFPTGPSSPFTISSWIKRESSSQSLFNNGTQSTKQFIIHSNIRIEDLSGWYDRPSSATKINDQWDHISIVYDGANIKIYNNGLLSDSRSRTLNLTETTFLFGSKGGASGDGGADFDDVRLYNRALSDDEIQSIYQQRFKSCASPDGHEGDTIYNNTNNVMQYCNGTFWAAMGAAGDGGAGCTGPIGAAGDLIYNDSFNVMQYCEGDTWMAIGK